MGAISSHPQIPTAFAKLTQVLGKTTQVTVSLLWCLVTLRDAARFCATLAWQAAKESPSRWSSMPTVQPLHWGLPQPWAQAFNFQASLAIRGYFKGFRPIFLDAFCFLNLVLYYKTTQQI